MCLFLVCDVWMLMLRRWKLFSRSGFWQVAHMCTLETPAARRTPWHVDSAVARNAQISMDWEMGDNVLEWKLVDVPELGYLTTDRPFPRGELVLKTGSMIKGYYKHAKVRRISCYCLAPKSCGTSCGHWAACMRSRAACMRSRALRASDVSLARAVMSAAVTWRAWMRCATHPVFTYQGHMRAAGSPRPLRGEGVRRDG